jgi:hypothetical protein
MDLSTKALRLSGQIAQSNELHSHRKKKDYKGIISLRYSNNIQEFCPKGGAHKIASPFFMGIMQFVFLK